jgi:hypothetical protein
VLDVGFDVALICIGACMGGGREDEGGTGHRRGWAHDRARDWNRGVCSRAASGCMGGRMQSLPGNGKGNIVIVCHFMERF